MIQCDKNDSLVVFGALLTKNAFSELKRLTPQHPRHLVLIYVSTITTFLNRLKSRMATEIWNPLGNEERRSVFQPSWKHFDLLPLKNDKLQRHSGFAARKLTSPNRLRNMLSEIWNTKEIDNFCPKKKVLSLNLSLTIFQVPLSNNYSCPEGIAGFREDIGDKAIKNGVMWSRNKI